MTAQAKAEGVGAPSAQENLDTACGQDSNQNGGESKAPIDYALAYAAAGDAVFPVWWLRAPGVCGCSHAEVCRWKGKHPLTLHGFKDATTDPEQIRAWWEQWPQANIGMATGPVFVLDADEGGPDDKKGLTNLTALQEKHGALPETREAKSGSGTGRHYYFKGVPDIKSCTDLFEPGCNIDVRAYDGYIILPPSRHSSGGTYEWLNDAPLADAPPWIIDPARARSTDTADGDADRSFKPTNASPEGVAKMVEKCLFVQHMKANAATIDGGLWNAAATNFATAGRAGHAAFHEISKLDATRKGPAKCSTIGTLGFKCPNMGDDGRCQLPGGGASPVSLVTTHWVDKLNTEHFVARESGQVRVFNVEQEHGRVMLTRSSFDDHRNFYCDRFVTIGEKKVPIGKAWLSSPHRLKYRKIMFVPGQDAPPGDYNLWQGFVVDPVPGDWSRLKRHMLEVACDGDQACYDYLIRWMARGVQRPYEQGWSAVVFRGGEGFGKGIIAQNYGALFGQHFLHISNSRHLVGNFNLHLRDCVVIFADEAFYAGDRQGEATLKTLITEDKFPIEGKGRDVVMGRNYIHLMMASNHEWVVPAGPDARRFFVLDVPDKRKGDKKWFDDIVAQMNNGGRAAMLHELMNMDLKDFRVTAFPRTKGLLAQQIHSMSPERGWWLDKLETGRVMRRDTGWPKCVDAEDLHDDYVAAAGRAGASRRATQVKLGIFLAAVMPEGFVRTKMTIKREIYEHPAAPPKIIDARRYVYLLPELEACRAKFVAEIGQDYPWPKDDSDAAEY
jgi:hypothetical protein